MHADAEEADGVLLSTFYYDTNPDGRVKRRAVAPKRMTGSFSAVGTSTTRAVPGGTASTPK